MVAVFRDPGNLWDLVNPASAARSALARRMGVRAECMRTQIRPDRIQYNVNTLPTRSLLAALALTLTACATNEKAITSAATTPLTDLNLVNAPIPEVLAAAQKAPYAAPADASCPALVSQVRSLDEALGPDLDAPATEESPGLVERSGAAIGDAATGALRRTAEGVIPFRGWVRKLSGAERYSKQVAAAIAAGTVRRAFLKGLAVAKGCV